MIVATATSWRIAYALIVSTPEGERAAQRAERRAGPGAHYVLGDRAVEQRARELARQGPAPLDAKQQREVMERAVLAGAWQQRDAEDDRQHQERERDYQRYHAQAAKEQRR
jgi:hypothetical protein